MTHEVALLAEEGGHYRRVKEVDGKFYPQTLEIKGWLFKKKVWKTVQRVFRNHDNYEMDAEFKTEAEAWP